MFALDNYYGFLYPSIQHFCLTMPTLEKIKIVWRGTTVKIDTNTFSTVLSVFDSHLSLISSFLVNILHSGPTPIVFCPVLHRPYSKAIGTVIIKIHPQVRSNVVQMELVTFWPSFPCSHYFIQQRRWATGHFTGPGHVLT